MNEKNLANQGPTTKLGILRWNNPHQWGAHFLATEANFIPQIPVIFSTKVTLTSAMFSPLLQVSFPVSFSKYSWQGSIKLVKSSIHRMNTIIH